MSYIIHGLDQDYQPLVSALDARVTPVTLDELFSMLSNFDQRMAQYHGFGGGFKSSANSASRGRGGGSRSRASSRGKGRFGSGGSGGYSNNARGGGRSGNSKGRRGGGSNRSRPDLPRCQICGNPGHTAKDCWYRATKRMIVTPHKMKKRWLRLPMAPMGSTQTGMLTVVPQTTSPTSMRNSP